MTYVNLNEHFVIFKQYPTPYSARVVQYTLIIPNHDAQPICAPNMSLLIDQVLGSVVVLVNGFKSTIYLNPLVC